MGMGMGMGGASFEGRAEGCGRSGPALRSMSSGCCRGKSRTAAGLRRVSLSRHLLCPRVHVCTQVCGVSVHACT